MSERTARAQLAELQMQLEAGRKFLQHHFQALVLFLKCSGCFDQLTPLLNDELLQQPTSAPCNPNHAPDVLLPAGVPSPAVCRA
jgi:hypothetical protein